jgi:hypothetical protein
VWAVGAFVIGFILFGFSTLFCYRSIKKCVIKQTITVPIIILFENAGMGGGICIV